MEITLYPNSNRRLAYTDRRDGYFEQWFSDQQLENGYHRGETRYLSGFSFQDVALTKNLVKVYPWKFVVHQGDDIFESSLLINERAFYIKCGKQFSVNDLVPAQKVSEENPRTGFVKNFYKPLVEQFWHKKILGTHTVVKDGSGNCICSLDDFAFTIENKDVYIVPSKDDQVFYVIMEKSDSISQIHALELLQIDTVGHNEKIIEEFLEKTNSYSGNPRFDNAILWSKYTAWLLATKDHGAQYRGIWAGLPWFRDNWGRDTFISLCGSLLVNGSFKEAKNVLMGFAGFQDLVDGSVSYGRIPNRYRNDEDVIYNTVDGTLWFIRALWEYVNYSGDEAILYELKDTVEIALDAESKRVDEFGFIIHDDADTWMDARIMGKNPWSPRGDRANDIQALWFTALRIGAIIEQRYSSSEKADKYNKLADKIKDNFIKKFWDSKKEILADHINVDGSQDFKCRPNQLFVLLVTQILPPCKENELVPQEIVKKILENCNNELVNPFGLYSLDPKNKCFHPNHENPDFYHKDAAYHNGTIWQWNTGAYITANCSLNGYMGDQANAILQNYSRLILDWGCAGSLSENIHARPDKNGDPILSGTFSQCWSMAEFNRNIYQDIAGFIPKLTEHRLELKPCLPKGTSSFKAKCAFGRNSEIFLEISRGATYYECSVLWQGSESYKEIEINGKTLVCGERLKVTIEIPQEQSNQKLDFICPADVWKTEPFPKRNLCPRGNGPTSKQNYLEEIILSGGEW